MNAFDSIAIAVDGADFITFQRTTGDPIETGYFDEEHVRHFASNRELVAVDGFSIDDAGEPYYTPDRDIVGEPAHLYIDPMTATVWLEAA